MSLDARRALVLARAAKELEALKSVAALRQDPQKNLSSPLRSSSNSLSSSSASISNGGSGIIGSTHSSSSALSSSGGPPTPKKKSTKRKREDTQPQSLSSSVPLQGFAFPQQASPFFERAPDHEAASKLHTSDSPALNSTANDQYTRPPGEQSGYNKDFGENEKPLLARELASESDDSDGLDSEFFEEDAFYSEYRGLDDWNARFQEAKTMIQEFDANTNIKDRIGVNVALIHLYQDFLYCVRTYSKIIISELYLPRDQKTIKPMEGLGGVAGGLKYRVNNILFKFAINHSGLYSDDFAAAKVAGLELKSLISYLNCEISDLHYPLMALVDYRGFRVVAMSVLPINKDTIKYGTNDAGLNIHAEDERLVALMAEAARKLNLQPHRCADIKRENFKVLHSAADVEGHKGLDGRYYLIDFSRTFPPETPDTDIKMSHLFQLLRPEFVHSYRKPLCSDAFSRFVIQEELKEYNSDIREATNYLHSTTIPHVAAEMDLQLSELVAANAAQHFRLIETVHSSGVNIRYLGRIRTHCLSKQLKELILIEMLARLLKTLMRLQLREMVKKLKVPLEQPYRRLLVDYLNLTFGESEKSDRYWDLKLKKKLQRKFDRCLSPDEAADGFRLKRALADITFGGRSGKRLLFEKLSGMMGLQFAPTVHTQLENAHCFTAETPFDYVDLEELREVVKHTNVMAHSQGYLLKMKGLHKNQAGEFVSAKRFFQMAIDKCEESLNSNPNHKLTLRNCAQLITFVEGALQPNAVGDFESSTMKRANRYHLRAIKADTSDAHSVFQYARFLKYCRKLEQAEDYYLRTLELDPTFERCLHEYAEFLIGKGNIDVAQKIFSILSAPMQQQLVPLEGFKSRQLRLSKSSTLNSSADSHVSHGSGSTGGLGRKDSDRREEKREV